MQWEKLINKFYHLLTGIYKIIFLYKMDLTIMELDINVVSMVSLLPHKPVIQYNREKS